MKKMLLWSAIAAFAIVGFVAPGQAQAKEPSLRPSDEKTVVERGPRRGPPRHRGRGGYWGGGYYGGGYWGGPRYRGPSYGYYHRSGPRVIVVPQPTYVYPSGGYVSCY